LLDSRVEVGLVRGSLVDHPKYKGRREAKRCFSLRALERFASFFGFADVRMPGRYQMGLPLEVKKKPFLDIIVDS